MKERKLIVFGTGLYRFISLTIMFAFASKFVKLLGIEFYLLITIFYLIDVIAIVVITQNEYEQIIKDEDEQIAKYG